MAIDGHLQEVVTLYHSREEEDSIMSGSRPGSRGDTLRENMDLGSQDSRPASKQGGSRPGSRQGGASGYDVRPGSRGPRPDSKQGDKQTTSVG